MKLKISVTAILLIFSLSVAASQLEFRTENPIDYYSSLNLQKNNSIIAPDKIKTGSGNDITIESPDGDVITNLSEQGDVKIENGELTLDNIEITQTGLIKSLRDDGDIYLDLGKENSQLNVRTNERDNILELSNAGVTIPRGNLSLNSNSIKNLQAPVDSDDAVRLQYVEDQFVDRYGDTLNGSLDLNGNNLTDIGYINLTSGLELNGSVNLSGGDINTEGGNIVLDGGYLSNDGDNEGLKVDNSGNVEVPSGDLDVSGLADLGDVVVRGNLNMDNGQITRVKAVRSDGSDLNLITSGSGNDAVEIYDQNNSQYIARFNEGGNIQIPNGNLNLGGGAIINANWSNANDLNSDGGISDFSNANDMDASGNVVSDSITSGEIAENEVGNSEIDNSVNIDLGTLDVAGGSVGDGTQSGLTVDSNGNLYFDGSLNFPGDVNTISAQKLNGSIVPDRDADQNIGSGSMRWNNGYFAGDIDIQGGKVIDSTGKLTIGDGNVEIPNGNLDTNGNNVTSSGGDICIGKYC